MAMRGLRSDTKRKYVRVVRNFVAAANVSLPSRRIEAHVKLCVLALQVQQAGEIRCQLPHRISARVPAGIRLRGRGEANYGPKRSHTPQSWSLASVSLCGGGIFRFHSLEVAVVGSLIADIQAVANRWVRIDDDRDVVVYLVGEFMRRQCRQRGLSLRRVRGTGLNPAAANMSSFCCTCWAHPDSAASNATHTKLFRLGTIVYPCLFK